MQRASTRRPAGARCRWRTTSSTASRRERRSRASTRSGSSPASPMRACERGRATEARRGARTATCTARRTLDQRSSSELEQEMQRGGRGPGLRDGGAAARPAVRAAGARDGAAMRRKRERVRRHPRAAVRRRARQTITCRRSRRAAARVTREELERVGRSVRAAPRAAARRRARRVTSGRGRRRSRRRSAAGYGVTRDVTVRRSRWCTSTRRRPPVFHLDLYRLDDPRELTNIGWDDMLGAGAHRAHRVARARG